MKLSEAVRKGAATGLPQIQSKYFQTENGTFVGACALGMACIGCGLTPEKRFTTSYFRLLLEHTGIMVHDATIPHPKNGARASLHRAVQYANDELRWTPEEIAGYLEQHGY